MEEYLISRITLVISSAVDFLSREIKSDSLPTILLEEGLGANENTRRFKVSSKMNERVFKGTPANPRSSQIDPHTP